MQKYTLKDFDTQFPDDDVCLEWLRRRLYPAKIFCPICVKPTLYHRVKTRKVYECDLCGHQLSPTAGTIFHKSSTSLRSWFYAIFVMSTTRTGFSAKQLERELGVTYKTAWRMLHQIRKLMNEDVSPLSGRVEVDATFVGGKAKNMHKAKRENIGGRGTVGKTAVLGMVERQGNVVTTIVGEESQTTVLPQVREKILPIIIVYSDEHAAYNPLKSMGYAHRRVHHSAKIYVQSDAHTNTIEGFWSLVKRGIGGVNHAVSQKYLQDYFNSYTFRWNHRNDDTSMFVTLLGQVTTGLPSR